MQYSPLNFGLPLLTKELIEQSARRRTYVIRTVYALVLYGTTLWIFQRQLSSGVGNGFSILGQGHTLFAALASLEFWGIYLFLPAMTCGVLTAEKERDTLGLLLLTKLGPWTIIFEKLFSRLVPMATFVLLSLPLLAIAYSLGGLEVSDIAKLMWILAATALQVGSFAVLCSTWFRTTAGAFLATYVLGAAMIAVSGLLFDYLGRTPLAFWFQVLLSPGAYAWLFSSGRPMVATLALGPMILEATTSPETLAGTTATTGATFLDCLLMTLPMLFTSFATLICARCVLWRRAFVQPKNVLLRIFKSLDTFFHRANNNSVTRGIVLIRESVTLPLYQPISWRETSKRSLGTTRYRIRFLLLLEFPLLFLILWPTTEEIARSGYAPAYIGAWCIWMIATLVLAIQSTGLIGTERSHQSLDVLLTTPIESDEIVRQKFAGVWRMIHVLWIPFTTVYLFQIWWQTWVNYPLYVNPYAANRANLPPNVIFVALRAVLAVSLYLPTIAWFGFYLGLRCRSQTQAILVAMTMITLLCAAPPAVGWFLTPQIQMTMYGIPAPPSTPVISWFSPAVILTSSGWDERDWVMIVLHFTAVAVLYLWLAQRSRRTFAKQVGRNDGYDGATIEYEDSIRPLPAMNRETRLDRLRRGQFGMRAIDDEAASDAYEEYR
jgi:ABC-type transport system involved in multi-copper enzyme maturation permease subunit